MRAVYKPCCVCKYGRMNIKSICLVLLMALVSFSAAPPVFAESNIDVLLKKLNALEEYLEQLTFPRTPGTQALPNEEMREIITDSVKWMEEAQEQNGHFAYEYLPYEDAYWEDDNIVRQAGALFELSEVARRSSVKDEGVHQTIERSITLFEDLSPEHEYKGEKMRCVTNTKESSTCKLGSTSLVLTGILGYVEASPEKTDAYADLIEEYAAYIMAAKKPDTGFRNEYKVDAGFRSEKESSFSNGEALLALTRYYQYSPKEEVKKVIDGTFEYLKDTQFDTGLYLWIMAALKDMQVLWPNSAYVAYGKEFTNWRIASVAPYRGTGHNYCAAAEGFASAYSLLKGNTTEAYEKSLRQEIDFWNKKNAGLQIAAGETYRVIKQDGSLYFKEIKNMEQSRGGFLTSDDRLSQRIDFTQHCISAYLQTLVDIDGQTL